MADDIVTRLREWGGDGSGYDIEDAVPCSMLREAADFIEAQQAEIERLRAEVEQLRINLANARTGRALLDLEHLRHDYADLHWRFTKLAALCEKILNEQWRDIMGGDGTRPTLTLPDSDQTT